MALKKELKLVNLTTLFDHIDVSLVSDEDIKKRIDFSQEKDQGTSIIEAPGLKAIILPIRKRGIIFEQNRLRLDDTSGNEPKHTDIFDYFTKISELLRQFNFLAYGFNFDILVKSDKEINFEEFLVERIKKSISGPIEGGATSLVFSADEKKFVLDVKSTGNPRELFFHLNVHYATDKIPDKPELVREMGKSYAVLQDLIGKIVS